MVWIYGDPPFPKKEKDVYVKLNRKLKDRELSEKIIKLWSLIMFLRKTRFNSWKEVQQAAYFDDAKTQPVFDDETAKKVYKLLQKRGGSGYEWFNEEAEKIFAKLGDLLPGIISEPVGFVYNGATGIFTEVVEGVPFMDLVLEMAKSGAAITTSTIENIAGAFGGAPGEIIAFLLTFVIASAAASIHLLQRDFGGAIEQILRALPVIGGPLQAAFQKGNNIGEKLERDADKIQAQIQRVKGALQEATSAVVADPRIQALRERGIQIYQRPEFQQAKAIAAAKLAQARDMSNQFLNSDRAQQAKAFAAAKLGQAKDLGTRFLKSDRTQRVRQMATDKFNQLRQRVALPNVAPAAGGKRFSTQRNTYSQWKKTRRQRSAKH